MLPHHPLSQLTPGRITGALRRLSALVWTNFESVRVEATAARPDFLALAEAKTLPRQAVEPGTHWGKLFDQRWCRIEIPDGEGPWWLHWCDQAEATLYVDGQPTFGFNIAHRFCRLPAGVNEVWTQSCCVQSAIWHPDAKGLDARGSLFESARVARRNDAAWHAYFDLKCLADAATDLRRRFDDSVPETPTRFGLQPALVSCPPVVRRIYQLLDEAIDAWETNGLHALTERLAAAYRELACSQEFARCVLTGHAHVDLVWLWPERVGEIKAVNVFSTVTHLLDEYPELRFAYSQPASYEAVRRREPALFQRVLEKIGSGSWEAGGAMYVESDTLLPCGEALARSFVIGQNEFSHFARQGRSRVVWLPDVFGYSACLPQILRQTGVDFFFTTKMTWNAINRFPHSSFIWRGNDGSEVLAHVTQDSGYNATVEVAEIKKPMFANMQAALHPEFLLPTGYGDGGGGPTPEMLERARRFRCLPGLPEIVWDQPQAFFERLDGVRDRLPVHQGECYLEYHRGTFTTHSALKLGFRTLERALQIAEAVAAATGVSDSFEHAWKRLIFAQFHDYIPGSSVWDVYAEGLPELAELAQGLQTSAQKALASEGVPSVFNPHPLSVRRWIETKGDPVFVEIPPLTGGAIDELPANDVPQSVTVNDRVVTNGLATFELDDAGGLARLEWEGVTVPLRGSFGRLMTFPDRPANFEAWDIDRAALTLGKLEDQPATIEPFRDGDHRAGFRVSRAIGSASHAVVTFALEAGSPLLHVSVDLDWNEPETLLKLILPTQFSAAHARFGAPFGSVLRSQVPDGLVAEARWEVPFSRYLSVFDDGERNGLFVVTEAKYGATVRDGVVGVSLVRSPHVTGRDPGHTAAWPATLTRYTDAPKFSDLGAHRIRLAVGRYDLALPVERQPAAVAETLFTEPLPYAGTPVQAPMPRLTGAFSLIPCWVQPTGDGEFIIRLHEVSGQRGRLQIEPARGTVCNIVRLDGQPCCAKNVTELDFQPYQIIGVRVRVVG
ncbi:MAG: glycoside hydrolase family 38 C-terminal domain-containing protein [Terrimicrobiaceae bacterium]|nr:glycoside hydrolase family 38 C-terminal domain-containing protein [Terrimicrobiaceae bacterium]